MTRASRFYSDVLYVDDFVGSQTAGRLDVDDVANELADQCSGDGRAE